MAELAVRDGKPPPSDLPAGEFICTRLPDGTVRVDHADPRILISGELLDQLVLEPAPCVQFDWPVPSFIGAVLKIHGVNQHVVYRITGYVPRVNGYVGEWPD